MIPARVPVRPMEPPDLDRVMEIAQGLETAPHWPRAAYQEALEPHSTVRRIALVAVPAAAQAVVGFAVASLVADQAELELIAVAPEAQRSGIAQSLFLALIEELKRAAANEILLEVRVSNHPAVSLYRALGFLQIALRQSYYIDPPEDAVLMRLALN